jgi:lysophospholipid acyltransferase
MVQVNLNYIASAFILLSMTDCIRAWHRMYWYGHVLVFGGMLFFQGGGRRRLRKGLESKTMAKPRPRPLQVPSFKLSPPSPIDFPDETNVGDLRWVKHALDNPSSRDDGEGVHPDAGLVDALVEGTETTDGWKDD